MKYHRTLLIILILSLFILSNQVTIELPVPQQTLVKLTLSIDQLKNVLKNFNTRYENKYEIYKRVQLTKKYLHELNQALCKYNNVIAGSGNAINGSKNIVIGNYNNINGSNNWVFISKFTGNVNGDLLVGDWRIEIDKSKYILINPRFAISFIDEEKNQKMKNKYFSKKRQICQWGKWTHPENEKASKHWQKFEGFKEWKSNEWQRTNSGWNYQNNNNLRTNNNNNWGNWGSWGSWGGWTGSWWGK